jgi:hypothetical protein
MPIAGNCAICGLYRHSLDEDHIIPRWKGGSDDPSNKQYICQNCHHDKTSKDVVGNKFREGTKHSPETLAKLSASHRQRYQDPEQREKQRQVQLKRFEDPAERAKCAVWGNTHRRGKKASAETKAKMSAARKGRPAWNSGTKGHGKSHPPNCKHCIEVKERWAKFRAAKEQV